MLQYEDPLRLVQNNDRKATTQTTSSNNQRSLDVALVWRPAHLLWLVGAHVIWFVTPQSSFLKNYKPRHRGRGCLPKALFINMHSDVSSGSQYQKRTRRASCVCLGCYFVFVRSVIRDSVSPWSCHDRRKLYLQWRFTVVTMRTQRQVRDCSPVYSKTWKLLFILHGKA